MSGSLKSFKENTIQNRDELLDYINNELNEYKTKDRYEYARTGKHNPMVRLFMDLKIQVEASPLPKCDDWWCYAVLVDNYGVDLCLSHCSSFNGRIFGYDRDYALITQRVEMLSVAQYAELHDVKPVTVRQWIRRGKLRCIKKRGTDWFVSALATPTDKYMPVTYSWNKSIRALIEQFPFLKDAENVHIKQNGSNKTKFIIKCEKVDGETVEFEMTDKEKETFELELLSQEEIYFDEESIT